MAEQVHPIRPGIARHYGNICSKMIPRGRPRRPWVDPIARGDIKNPEPVWPLGDRVGPSPNIHSIPSGVMTGGCINPEWRQGPAHVQSLPAVVFWILVMSLAQSVEKQLLLRRDEHQQIPVSRFRRWCRRLQAMPFPVPGVEHPVACRHPVQAPCILSPELRDRWQRILNIRVIVRHAEKNLPHRIPGSHFIFVNHRCDWQGLIQPDTFKTITHDLQLRRRPCIGAGIKWHPTRRRSPSLMSTHGHAPYPIRGPAQATPSSAMHQVSLT